MPGAPPKPPPMPGPPPKPPKRCSHGLPEPGPPPKLPPIPGPGLPNPNVHGETGISIQGLPEPNKPPPKPPNGDGSSFFSLSSLLSSPRFSHGLSMPKKLPDPPKNIGPSAHGLNPGPPPKPPKPPPKPCSHGLPEPGPPPKPPKPPCSHGLPEPGPPPKPPKPPPGCPHGAFCHGLSFFFSSSFPSSFFSSLPPGAPPNVQGFCPHCWPGNVIIGIRPGCEESFCSVFGFSPDWDASSFASCAASAKEAEVQNRRSRIFRVAVMAVSPGLEIETD